MKIINLLFTVALLFSVSGNASAFGFKDLNPIKIIKPTVKAVHKTVTKPIVRAVIKIHEKIIEEEIVIGRSEQPICSSKTSSEKSTGPVTGSC